MARRIAAQYALGIMVFAVLAFSLVNVLAPHLVINHTTSLPRGLYWREAVSADGVQRGNIVIVCIPHRFLMFAKAQHMLEHGECEGLESMLKIVVGVPGDHVQLSSYGVTVNDGLIPNSRPYVHNQRGLKLIHVPHRLYVLQPGEFWLATPNPLSFDSRYYGPVRRVLAIAKPIVTF